jgi:plastocyanin
MIGVETEEPSGPSTGFLAALVGGSLLVVVLVAAALAIPLQPGLPSGCTSCTTVKGAEIEIPGGTGDNPKLNYSPDKAVVIIGTNNTVTFVNEDAVKHTVTATDNSFNSGDILPGGSWVHTFTTPGTYTYYCIYHSGWMRGTITVEDES